MRIFYRCTRFILASYFKVAYRHRVYGLKHVLVRHEGCIIAANHLSFLDPPMIGASIPIPIHFFARSSLFKGKIASLILSSLNAIPLTRSIDHQAFKKLGKGAKILIFPEGTRSEDGELKEFNLGVALLAKTLDMPVVPAYIHGTFEAWPRGRRFPYLTGRTFLAFGPPLSLNDFKEGTKKEQYRAFTDALEKSVSDLKAQYSPK